MKKQNLYEELKLEKFYWGGAIKFNFMNIDINSNVIDILDKICIEEGLIPLNTEWNEINHKDFDDLLHSALQFDLGFTKYEIMNTNEAEFWYNILTEKLDIQEARYFTNWFNNPWKSLGGGSFNSLSPHTMDLAVAMIDATQILFVYFLFED